MLLYYVYSLNLNDLRRYILSTFNTRKYIIYIQGSEQKAQEFLEFLQEGRESFIADAATSYNELKTQQVQIKVWSIYIPLDFI